MSRADWYGTDYYAVLGVTPDASASAIKKAFRVLAKRYHPDSNRDDPSAAATFAQVSAAYDVLSDATARAEYDLTHGTVPTAGVAREAAGRHAAGFSPPAPSDVRGPGVGSVVGAGGQVEGWYEDPYDLHEHRWFSHGTPTHLVRDDGVTSYDAPPAGPVHGPLVPAPEHTPPPFDMSRADDGTDPEGDLAGNVWMRSRARFGLRVYAVFAVVLLPWLFLSWRSGLSTVELSDQSWSGVVQVGQTYYADTGLTPSGGPLDSPSVRISVDSVHASAVLTTTTSTGAATSTRVPIETVVCVRRPGTPGIQLATAAEAAASCSTLRRFAVPDPLQLGPSTTQVLYKVVVTASPGRWDGFSITCEYEQGLRRGTAGGTSAISLVTAQ